MVTIKHRLYKPMENVAIILSFFYIKEYIIVQCIYLFSMVHARFGCSFLVSGMIVLSSLPLFVLISAHELKQTLKKANIELSKTVLV